jgi:uncharacterized membrane protein YgcG
MKPPPSMRVPRTRIRRCAFLAIGLLALFIGNARAAEVIDYFESDVKLAQDGELTVTETLQVQAEGRAIRRGIFRDFPLLFADASGAQHEVTFSLLGVSRDGKPEFYHTERQHGFIRIYAGDKDVIIPPGNHTYVFRYSTGRQIRWFDGKPELNWNVTGNFWNFPITRAVYRLHLPGGAQPVHWTAFTGLLGARGTNWQADIGALGTLTVSTTRALAPSEGLTVVAEIPSSAVDPPSPSTLMWYRILDNRRWILAGGGFLLVFLYYVVAWTAVGRDPKGGAIIPLFHPPPGVSPALTNYIHNWGFGREKWRAFTAAALSLAVRGIIRFEQDGDTLMLKATGRQPAGGLETVPAGERAIFGWVNAHGGLARISTANGEAVAKVGASFTASIEAECRNRFFRRNLRYVIAGLVLTALVVFAVIKFGGLRDEDIGILIATAFAGGFAGLFVVPLLAAVFGGGGMHVLVRRASSLIVLVAFGAVAANFVAIALPKDVGGLLPAVTGFVEKFPFGFVLVPAFAALNGIFFYLMKAPTTLGRPVMDQLDGLRLYLETAEAYRLNAQAPEITTERFEALLPYAVALDVEKPWADAFAAALRRAFPDDADPARHYQTAWTGGGSWSSENFGSAVAASVSGVSSALASAVPVSSGSSGFSGGGGGGGGGSGGGGGGGGGGGW